MYISTYIHCFFSASFGVHIHIYIFHCTSASSFSHPFTIGFSKIFFLHHSLSHSLSHPLSISLFLSHFFRPFLCFFFCFSLSLTSSTLLFFCFSLCASFVFLLLSLTHYYLYNITQADYTCSFQTSLTDFLLHINLKIFASLF